MNLEPEKILRSFARMTTTNGLDKALVAMKNIETLSTKEEYLAAMKEIATGTIKALEEAKEDIRKYMKELPDKI